MMTTAKTKIDIGPDSILNSLPAEITIEGRPYILSQTSDKQPVLFTAICPHQHGKIHPEVSGVLRCSNHNWTFNAESGKGIHPPRASLEAFDVFVESGRVFAAVPPPSIDSALTDVEDKLRARSSGQLPRIKIISNACMLIRWNDFSLLTDPWIEGPAFLGGWTQYPSSGIRVKDLTSVDAIWITHEHSDHLHLYSLSKFDKQIPVYVPVIDNRRLVNLVRDLGFVNVIGTVPRKKYQLAEGVEAVSFKSGSVWNDSIAYFTFGGFSILNVNDAGLNWEVKEIIKRADVVCSSFSFGATGYPLTWSHLTDERKRELVEDSNEGMRKMLNQLVEMFNPRFLLPIASFNSIFHPDHLPYLSLLARNLPRDIVDTFADSSVKVLDLIPGETWDGPSGKMLRVENRERFWRPELLHAHLKAAFDGTEDYAFFKPEAFTIGFKEIKNYFEAFSGSKILHEIGNTDVAFTARENGKCIYSRITFNDGTVMVVEVDEQPSDAALTMECPGGLVQKVLAEDLSWDEMHIGYWCKFSRNPDVYNIAFWQLLHAPWKHRQKTQPISAGGARESELRTASIADVVEKIGQSAISVMQKYGLNCVGCSASIGETIDAGCRSHGLSEEQTAAMFAELEQHCSSTSQESDGTP